IFVEISSLFGSYHFNTYSFCTFLSFFATVWSGGYEISAQAHDPHRLSALIPPAPLPQEAIFPRWGRGRSNILLQGACGPLHPRLFAGCQLY
ncbi:MAG: hypothetical protein ACI4WV_03420, partial [Eubacteriales bacterium]